MWSVCRTRRKGGRWSGRRLHRAGERRSRERLAEREREHRRRNGTVARSTRVRRRTARARAVVRVRGRRGRTCRRDDPARDSAPAEAANVTLVVNGEPRSAVPGRRFDSYTNPCSARADAALIEGLRARARPRQRRPGGIAADPGRRAAGSRSPTPAAAAPRVRRARALACPPAPSCATPLQPTPTRPRVRRDRPRCGSETVRRSGRRRLGLRRSPDACRRRRATRSCAGRTARRQRLGVGVARDERRVAAAARRAARRACRSRRPGRRSSTTIWSASRTVESRWAIAIVVRPSASRSSASCTRRSVCVSSAEVASSSTRIGGLRSIVRAIAIRCFSPPEKR